MDEEYLYTEIVKIRARVRLARREVEELTPKLKRLPRAYRKEVGVAVDLLDRSLDTALTRATEAVCAFPWEDK